MTIRILVRFSFSLLTGILFVACFHLRLIIKKWDLHHVPRPYEGQIPVANTLTEKASAKAFIYLVQTENCLPSQLKSFDQLGDEAKLDVIVLSWKKKCLETTAHFVYYFDNTTSWSAGRNLLYRLAMARKQKYLYYIFLDDDLDFSFTPNLPRDIFGQDKSKSPLRMFETFLSTYEPAVGLSNFCSRCGKMLANGSYIAHLCCSTRTASGALPPILPVSITFDAAFNAFHANATRHLLPYKLKYEEQSWWESQKYIILSADVLFRGQVVRYNGITALNQNHGKYPQEQLDNWWTILEHIRTEVPSKYRNQSVFLLEPLTDMVPEVSDDVFHTERWNITIPGPKAPIVPYRHFTQNDYS